MLDKKIPTNTSVRKKYMIFSYLFYRLNLAKMNQIQIQRQGEFFLILVFPHRENNT